jgi:microcompartment protein CcmL/EutN
MTQGSPALAMIELCSVAQGVIVHDALLKRAHVFVEWARVYNPGKYAIFLRGGEEEVSESLEEARRIAGAFEIDAIYLALPHPQLIRSLTRDGASDDAKGHGGAEPAVGVIECYSLCATLRAADRALKEADLFALALRIDPTLGGKGCFMFTGALEDVEVGIEAGRAGAGPAFFYHAQHVARPHGELPLGLITEYPSPQDPRSL